MVQEPFLPGCQHNNAGEISSQPEGQSLVLGENKADQKSNDKPNKNPSESIAPTNANPVVEPNISHLIPGMGPVLDIASGVILYLLGDDFQNWGMAVLGFFFHYLALVAASFIVADWVFGKWPNRKCIWSLYAVWCVLLAVLYVSLTLPKPSHELLFALRKTSLAQITEVDLTNDFLFPIGGPRFIAGCLVLPMPPPTSQGPAMTLTFTILNESEKKAKNIEVLFGIDANKTCSFSSEWRRSEDAHPKAKGGEFVVLHPSDLETNRGEELPTISPWPKAWDQWEITVILSGENVQDSELCFWAMFPIINSTNALDYQPYVTEFTIKPNGELGVPARPISN